MEGLGSFFRKARRSAPENYNCYTLFKAGFSSDLHKVFVEDVDGRPYTFDDLDDISGRLARRLHDAGVRAGDRVVVQADKSAYLIFLYVACLRYGAIFTPINPGLKPIEIEHVLRDAAPALVVCRPQDEPIIRERAPSGGSISIRTLGSHAAGTLREGLESVLPLTDVFYSDGSDGACIFYTSGTTGKPKGAVLTHRNFYANIQAVSKVWRMTSDDRILHALPMFHVLGLHVMVNLALYSASQLMLVAQPRTDALIRSIPLVTVVFGTPSMYAQLLEDARLTSSIAGRVRLFIAGAAALDAQMFEQFLERTEKPIVQRYGMSETLIIASNPIGGERAGASGVPLAGTDVRIIGENGSEVAVGDIGSIEVRSPSVFTGYWNDVEKTENSFTPDGFFKTGDLGSVDHDGYISIAGRIQDVVISYGANIYPKEVENTAASIDGVAESAAFGVPHSIAGELLVLAVVRKPGVPKLDERTIRNILSNNLADYKVPRRILLVDDLPRTAMGKVQKSVLRQRYSNVFADL
jgi:malonyl-CoA/methylmalonyl-CoA synthetase